MARTEQNPDWESRNVKLPDDTWKRLRETADARMVGHGLLLARAIDYYLDLLDGRDVLDPPPVVQKDEGEKSDPGPMYQA